MLDEFSHSIQTNPGDGESDERADIRRMFAQVLAEGQLHGDVLDRLVKLAGGDFPPRTQRDDSGQVSQFLNFRQECVVTVLLHFLDDVPIRRLQASRPAGIQDRHAAVLAKLSP